MPSGATMGGGHGGARRHVFRADVQGLRMVAVVAVILDHLLGWPSGGFVGVDVFFVISGFLITSLLLREHERTGTISFVGFYRRRVKRILPAATLVITVTLIASLVLLSRVRFVEIFWDGVWATLFAANWHFALNGTDYFQPEVMLSPLQHYWSLSVEEQFYFVWPWLMLAIFWLAARFVGGGEDSHHRARRIVGIVITVIVVASFAWSVAESVISPTWAYFSTFSRAWELGIGATIAVYAPLCRAIRGAWRPVLGWVGLIGIVVSLFVVNDSLPFPGPWAFLPVAATGLVIVAGTGGTQRYLWPLMNPVATYLGDASYSLYLWHWPIIVLVGAYLPLSSPLVVVLVAGLIALLSFSCYHFVEDPIRRSAWLDPASKRAPRRPRDHGSGLLASKIVAVGTTSALAVGMVALALAPRIDTAAAGAERTAVFLGDSYTVGTGGTGPGWAQQVSARLGWSMINLAAGGTGYVQSATVDGCGREHCGPYLEESQKITGSPSVIVVSGGRNDPGDDVADAARSLFASLADRFPAATVIALSPWWDATEVPPSLTSKAASIQTAASQEGAVYIDTGQPFAGHPELISGDGVHPNDAGYTALADTVVPLLAQATGATPSPVDATSSDVDPADLQATRTAQVRDALRATSWPALTPAVDVLGDAARVPEWEQDHCLNVSAENVDACVYENTVSDQVVALLGDSHAISYMPTLRVAFSERRIQSLTMQQCPAAAVDVELRTSQGSSAYPECTDHRAWVQGWLEEHKPQTVVVVDTWDTPTRMPGDDDASKLRSYQDALISTINESAALGAKVIVIASPPPGLNLVDCKTPLSSPSDCVRTIPRSYSEWTSTLADAVRGAAAPASTQFVPTVDWFCDGGSCPSFIDGVTVFADGNHLTDAAARAVGPLLTAALTP